MLYSPQTLLGLACALCLLGFSGNVAAQDLQAPLSAMREAAEEQADVDPTAATTLEASRLRQAVPARAGHAQAAAPTGNGHAGAAPGPADAKSPAERLHDAMRAIARDEVARDLATADAAARGTLAGGRRAIGGKGSLVDSEREERERARGAAVQAQSAKAVGAQRALEVSRGNGNAGGASNGNANGRAALSSPPGLPGASGAPRPR